MKVEINLPDVAIVLPMISWALGFIFRQHGGIRGQRSASSSLFVALTCFFRGCCNSASYAVGSTLISLNSFAGQVDQLDVTYQGHQFGN